MRTEVNPNLLPAGRCLGRLLPAALITAALLASGCQGYAVRREPLTTAQIIDLSREGRPIEEIIKKIQQTQTVYVLSARDVKNLLEQGVDERVVNEMLETRVRDAADSWRRAYYAYPYPYPYPYYGYGPYFGWGFGYHGCYP